MKKVIIKQFEHAEVADNTARFGFLKIPSQHDMIRAEGEEMIVSDGYHTFDELYDHRIHLLIALCKQFAIQWNDVINVWRSKKHSDGSDMEGWFIMGIGKEKGEQITYHLPIKFWDTTVFAEDLEEAPEFDGHSSDDVLQRLLKL